ncbi:MAG: TRAP transporter large permease [Janthinobacterium lividum]
MITAIVFGLFCGFLMLRVPVAIAMIAASICTLLLLHVPLVVIPQSLQIGLDSFEMLAVPFFILAAEIMNTGGITRRIVRLANLLVGAVPGSLAQVSVVASVVFAGISGTAIGDAAGLGRVQFLAMRENGYEPGFAAAVPLAAAVIGGLGPSSVVLILYAVSAEVSVGRMLLAGTLPLLIIAFALMAYIFWLVKTGRVSCPPTPRPRRAEILPIIFDGLPALVTPTIILTGLVSGWFTPAESGVAACVYSFLLCALYYRSLPLQEIPRMFLRATLSTAMVMFVISASTLMSWIITYDQAAANLVEIIAAWHVHPWLLLAVINVALLAIGAFVEGVPALLILTPILLPLVKSVGVDPVHFGVIMVFNLLIGLIHPPIGLGLFIMSNVTGLSVEKVTRAVIPFLIPLVIALIAITYLPFISMTLPNLVLR